MTDPPTIEVARAARGGDAESFAALYERLAPALVTWSRLRIRPALRHLVDPEDVLHEVWLRAWARLDTWEPDRRPFRSWLFRIAELVLIEGFRGLRGRPLEAGPGGGRPPEEMTARMTTIGRRLASQDVLRRAADRLAALPRDDRHLLIHRGLEGLAHEEVAERLGVTPAVSRKRWERLRLELQRLELPALLLGEDD